MENAFENISEQIQTTTGHHEAKDECCQRHCFYCVVLHNMLTTHQDGADRPPTRANDVAALQNEQVVYVPDNNYRNPSRVAKHQRELLKDYLNLGGIDWAGGQDLRCFNQIPWGQKLASICPL